MIPIDGPFSWQAWARRAQDEGGATFRIDGVYQPNSRWHRRHMKEIKLRSRVRYTLPQSLASITKGEAERGGGDIIEEVT